MVAFAKIFASERAGNKAMSSAIRIEFNAMSQSTDLTSARMLARNTILNFWWAEPRPSSLVAIPFSYTVSATNATACRVAALAWLVVGYSASSTWDWVARRPSSSPRACGADEPGGIATVSDGRRSTMMAVFGVVGGVAICARVAGAVDCLNIPLSLLEALHTFWAAGGTTHHPSAGARWQEVLGGVPALRPSQRGRRTVAV